MIRVLQEDREQLVDVRDECERLRCQVKILERGRARRQTAQAADEQEHLGAETDALKRGIERIDNKSAEDQRLAEHMMADMEAINNLKPKEKHDWGHWAVCYFLFMFLSTLLWDLLEFCLMPFFVSTSPSD